MKFLTSFFFLAVLSCSSQSKTPANKITRFEWLPSKSSANDSTKSTPLPKSERQEPDFVKVDVYRKSEEGTIYGDIISHSKPAPDIKTPRRSTNAHETTHGINSFLRMAHTSVKSKKNGFYVLQGRGVILEEPNLRLRDVHAFVPKNLRSYRWNLYLENALKDWDDTPTYVFDEWVAYVNGGATAVDDINKGKTGKWIDAVSGCCEFSIYSIGLGMAVKQKDPQYWKTNEQFKNFLVWELRNAQAIFLEGRVMTDLKSKSQDELLLLFLESESAKPLRQFCREELDGVWLDIDPKTIRDSK